MAIRRRDHLAERGEPVRRRDVVDERIGDTRRHGIGYIERADGPGRQRAAAVGEGGRAQVAQTGPADALVKNQITRSSGGVAGGTLVLLMSYV